MSNFNAYLIKLLVGFAGGYALGYYMPHRVIPLTFTLAILWGVVVSASVDKLLGE